MSSIVRRAAAFFALLVLAGCNPNVGPTGLVIGGSCTDEYDCAAGSYCLRRSDFPNGACTKRCSDDDDCRGETCIEEEGGICLLSCETDETCGRTGYVCGSRTRRGAAGQAPVCVGG